MSRFQSRDRQKQQAAGLSKSASLSKVRANAVTRNSIETPKQKFDRLLSEGFKPVRKKHSSESANSELEIISPEGTVNIDWESHPEASSGCFVASVPNKEHYLEAKLEDEADNRIYTFTEKTQVKTHVLPLGEVGDSAYFDVVNKDTGETAVAKATTYSVVGGIGNWIKKLFS